MIAQVITLQRIYNRGLSRLLKPGCLNSQGAICEVKSAGLFWSALVMKMVIVK